MEIGVQAYRSAEAGDMLVWFFVINALATSVSYHCLINQSRNPLKVCINTVSIFYLFNIVYILNLSLPDAIAYLKAYDESLGTKLPERSYAMRCSMSFDDIRSNIDLFVVQHIIEWIVTGAIFQDRFLCLIKSIGFELIEYSLQHQLPNFAECWWDHWILDVIICNGLGMEIGIRCAKWLGLPEYNWRTKAFIVDKSSNDLQNNFWSTVHNDPILGSWSMLGYIMMTVIIVGSLSAATTYFCMKYLLWIPSHHVICVIRNFFIYLPLMLSAVSEFHYMTILPDHQRDLTSTYFFVIMNIVELYYCFYWGWNQFQEPIPSVFVIAWATIFIIWLYFPLRICQHNALKEWKMK